MVHVDAHSDDNIADAGNFSIHLSEDATDFFAGDEHIIRPFQVDVHWWGNLLDGGANGQSGGERQNEDIRWRQRWPKDNRAIDSGGTRGLPGVSAAAAAGGLFFGEKCAAFRSSIGGCGHGGGVGGCDFVEMMKVGVEDGATQQGGEDLGEQQVGNRLQAIAGGGMSGNVYTEAAQLLNEAPDFGAGGRNFLRDFGAADDDGGVFHEKTDDTAQAEVSRLGARVAGFRGQECPRHTSCLRLPNEGIMRESKRNNNLAKRGLRGGSCSRLGGSGLARLSR